MVGRNRTGYRDRHEISTLPSLGYLAYPTETALAASPDACTAAGRSCASLPRELTWLPASPMFGGNYSLPLIAPSTTVGEPRWPVRTRRILLSAPTDRRRTARVGPTSPRPSSIPVSALPPNRPSQPPPPPIPGPYHHSHLRRRTQNHGAGA